MYLTLMVHYKLDPISPHIYQPGEHFPGLQVSKTYGWGGEELLTTYLQ